MSSPGLMSRRSAELRHELVPARGRPAQLVLHDRVVGEATLAEVGRPRSPAFDHQHRVVEGDGGFDHGMETGTARVLAADPVVELDASPAGQQTARLREAEAVALHHEREDVAALATAEAMPGVAGWGDDERRGLLAVERAEALAGSSRPCAAGRSPPPRPPPGAGS